MEIKLTNLKENDLSFNTELIQSAIDKISLNFFYTNYSKKNIINLFQIMKE